LVALLKGVGKVVCCSDDDVFGGGGWHVYVVG
jgi:hypothetical protein